MRWCRIAPVASEPGGFEAVDGADPSLAHGSDELLEAGTDHQAGARAAQIVVDGGDGGEASGLGRVGKGILASLALQVAEDLREGGLTDVDDGGAGEVVRGDLRAHRHPPS